MSFLRRRRSCRGARSARRRSRARRAPGSCRGSAAGRAGPRVLVALACPGGRGDRSCRGGGQCNLTDRRTEASMNQVQLADYAVGSPTRLALNVLAHKWTLLIVLALKRGPLRFTRLRSLIPGVTSQVLRDSLRELQRDGIVVRQEFVAVPPHVEYSLTELGATLCEPARAIRAWAEENGSAVLAPPQRYDSSGGAPRWGSPPPPPRLVGRGSTTRPRCPSGSPGVGVPGGAH